MSDIKKLYIEFINECNPYWECYEEPEEVTELEPSGMLYNLLCIDEELTDSLSRNFDEDIQLLHDHLKATIEKFRAEGIEIL